MKLAQAIACGAALALGACASPTESGRTGGAEALLSDMGVPYPTPARFTLCVNGGCAEKKAISLTPAQWAAVARVFRPAPQSAAGERARISRAIAVLEVLTGPQAGTVNENGGSLNFFTGSNQFDCYDESTNTTGYLLMMRDAGLIRYHSVGGPLVRGFFVMGWPHQSASIRDRKSGRIYAVDSWFFDNGTPAAVVPYETWRGRGWAPASAPRRLTAADVARLTEQAAQP